jgi:hypothetical protein
MKRAAGDCGSLQQQRHDDGTPPVILREFING